MVSVHPTDASVHVYTDADIVPDNSDNSSKVSTDSMNDAGQASGSTSADTDMVEMENTMNTQVSGADVEDMKRDRENSDSSADSTTALTGGSDDGTRKDVEAQQSNSDTALTPYVYKGCSANNIFRRLFHVLLNSSVPLLYYLVCIPYIGANIVNFVAPWLIIVAVVLERVRLHFKILLPSQREYERYQFSALGWTAVMLCTVLSTMRKEQGIPICLCLAVIDPLMGELRRFKWSDYLYYFIGFFTSWIIWGVSTFAMAECTFWYLGIIVGPIQVIAEKPVLKVIDDNAMMLLTGLVSSLICMNLALQIPFKVSDANCDAWTAIVSPIIVESNDSAPPGLDLIMRRFPQMP